MLSCDRVERASDVGMFGRGGSLLQGAQLVLPGEVLLLLSRQAEGAVDAILTFMSTLMSRVLVRDFVISCDR